ncbi:MAG TPA: alpha/beta hydrolase [Anaerolineales bacterium]|nr:alpha/beta hydrolase [Anaerolineales bacterium]
MKSSKPKNTYRPQIIPGLDLGGSGTHLHFAHANGYPPGAYRVLLEQLARVYHVIAMYQRPLWKGSQPQELTDWRLMAQDLDQFLDQENMTRTAAVGHSMGATNSLRLAIQKPKRFTALVLLDPVIFPAWMSPVWQMVMKLGLGFKLHPLAATTLRRRRSFANQQAMFEHYRAKPVFSRIQDESLLAYTLSLSRITPDGQVELAYSPEWETRIYLTGSLADQDIWRGIRKLSIPTLILRGQETDTFLEHTAHRLKKVAPHIEIKSIPETGHLLPLEKPQAVANIILDFLGTKS